MSKVIIHAKVVFIGNSSVMLDSGVSLKKAHIKNWPIEEDEQTMLNTDNPVPLLIEEWIAIQRGLFA
jgi:hypothetical protein